MANLTEFMVGQINHDTKKSRRNIDRALTMPAYSLTYHCSVSYTFTGLKLCDRGFFSGWIYLDSNSSSEDEVFFNFFGGTNLGILLNLRAFLGNSNETDVAYISGSGAVKQKLSLPNSINFSAGWHNIITYIDGSSGQNSWYAINGSVDRYIFRYELVPLVENYAINQNFNINSIAPSISKLAHCFYVSDSMFDNEFSGIDFTYSNSANIVDAMISSSTMSPKYGGADGSAYLGTSPFFYQANLTNAVKDDVNGTSATFDGANSGSPPECNDDLVMWGN